MESPIELLEIRLARLDDIESVNAIQEKVLSSDHLYRYAENIRHNGTMNLVATVRGQVAGFISVLVNQPNPSGQHLWERMRPYVGFIGISPEFQRCGIGQLLIKEASQKTLSGSRSSHIYLECEKNTFEFYRRLGFIEMNQEEVEMEFSMTPKSTVFRAHQQTFGPG